VFIPTDLVSLACVAAVVTGAVAFLWRRGRTGDPEGSMVLLLRRWKEFDARTLSDAVSRATGKPVQAFDLSGEDKTGGRRRTGDFVAGALHHFVVKVNGMSFAIHTFPVPYTEDPEKASNSFADLHLRAAIQEHRAWISMDILESGGATAAAYRILGRVLAEIVDGDCLAVYQPKMSLYSASEPGEVRAHLCSEDPLVAVFQGSFTRQT
jgi:hypothetical protein